jgi:Asp-tRNA(Asn)/Glu-tRNA(Gln) amidotransferase C subunit
MLDIEAHLREDIKNVDIQVNQKIIKNSPKSEDNFFVVSKIIE